MLLKPFFVSLVTFFVAFHSHADQKSLAFLNSTNGLSSQVEWYIDSHQGSNWSLNLKGAPAQLTGIPQTGVTHLRARIVDRESGRSLIDWEGTDDTRYASDENIYFLLTTGDIATIKQLQNPDDTLDVEISYQATKGDTSTRLITKKFALRDYCEALPEHVSQLFSGETGCFHVVTDNAKSGRCTAAEQDTFCNTDFRDDRPGIEKRLGCELSCH